jgi:hypothetical protein
MVGLKFSDLSENFLDLRIFVNRTKPLANRPTFDLYSPNSKTLFILFVVDNLKAFKEISKNVEKVVPNKTKKIMGKNLQLLDNDVT